jgi:hypothetical protein
MLACLAWAASHALAQSSAQKPPTPAGKDYTLSYAIVILVIVLGVMVVVRPGRRGSQVKHTEADEG